MIRRVLVLAVFAALVLALATAVEAKPIRTNITLSQDATLNGTTLERGEYRVEVVDDTVTIRQGREVLVELPAKWKDLSHPARGSGVVMREGKIIEIRFRGHDRALLFE